MLFCLAGCKEVVTEDKKEAPTTVPADLIETTVPEETEQVTTLPSITEPDTTEDPFEFESEIDISDFVTEPDVTEPEVTEPVATQPQATEPTPTYPAPTEPQPSEPEPTEPVVLPTEPDGYKSPIVRP